MLKIRLRRTGAKFQPTYRVVVADSRAPRDGAFVAILGFYNPRSEPATITVDEAALREWIRKGAQPTDSVLSVLRTGNLTPDLLERFSKRMIGAGGKRGLTTAGAATPAPAEAPTPAATQAPVAALAPITLAPIAAPAETPAPDEAQAPVAESAEATASDATPDTTEG